MPFADQSSANLRLINDKTPLTEEELHDLLPWVRVLTGSAREALQAELLLKQLLALGRQEQLATRQLKSFDEFDKSARRANRWMIGFTAAVFFMTLIMMLIGLYSLREHSGNAVTSQAGYAKQAQVASPDKTDEQVKVDTKTWENAEVDVTCSNKEHLLPWYSTDGKSNQVTLTCTIKNLTDKSVALATPAKVDALFLLPDHRVVRGRAYLGSSQHQIPPRGEIRDAGLFPGDKDCSAKQSDYDCGQDELMKANELLLTDTVNGVRYHISVE
jgi:hypothetical protein